MESSKKKLIHWIIILASFNIIVIILWNTYTLFQTFKNEERVKMELWAAAQKTINNADLMDTDIDLSLFIISKNTSIPIILTNEKDSIIGMINIDTLITGNEERSNSLLKKLKKNNDPVVMEYAEGKFNLLYYGNSSLLIKLQYYPLALILIIIMFIGIVLNFYRASKIATQNKLWAGMAKETAHQIGTPLSSLIGWLEIMKTENIDPLIIYEIEKDIIRLQTITDRFSKIGSEPILKKVDLVMETKQSFDYLKSRFSEQIEFYFTAPDYAIPILLNPSLHSWTIENLMKNAIDAMKGRGKLSVNVIDSERTVKILVQDTGKGIPKNQFNNIFEPGFTTKKRGWGLGLSLTKRIVEEYHKGKIKVLQSEIERGTTMQIIFKKITD